MKKFEFWFVTILSLIAWSCYITMKEWSALIWVMISYIWFLNYRTNKYD